MTASPVAVVIPARNAAPFIAETLDSLRRQTVADWRAVVVDDGSSDGTAGIVAALADPRIELHRQDPGGVSAARNAGLARVTEPVVLFLDADDILYPDALARLGMALAADDGLVMAYGEAAVFHGDGPAVLPFRAGPARRRPRGADAHGFLAANPVPTPGCVLVRTAAARAAGGFDESLRLGEDWEFLARLAARGAVVHLAGPPVLRYRIHAASAARRLAGDGDLLLATVERMFESGVWQGRLDPAALAALRTRARAHALAYTATECLKAGDLAAARGWFRRSLRLDRRVARVWLLWACAELGILPRSVRLRLK